MIEKLTSEQESAILFYHQKWQNISRSTKPIDRDKAIDVLREVHEFHLVGHPFEEILFLDSPCAAFNAELQRFILSEFDNKSDDDIADTVADSLFLHGEGLLRLELWSELYPNLPNSSINYHTEQFLEDRLIDREGEKRHQAIWNFLSEWLKVELRQAANSCQEARWSFWCNFIDPDSEWISYPALFEFYFKELKCDYDRKQWDIYTKVLIECGHWFLPGSRHWIICDRPVKLLLDEEGTLHADGEPAIEYSDGFGLYAQHGNIQSMVMPNIQKNIAD